MPSNINPRQFLTDLYSTAVSAVSAAKCQPAFLPKPTPGGRTLVIGAGKGAAAMAKAVEDNWKARSPAWSSRATVMAQTARKSKWLKPRIRYRMKPVVPPLVASCKWCKD